MPLEINNETYYTVNEACDFLAITRDTLYRRIREGRLQKYTHGATNRVYFRLTDLNALRELHPAQVKTHPDNELHNGQEQTS